MKERTKLAKKSKVAFLDDDEHTQQSFSCYQEAPNKLTKQPEVKQISRANPIKKAKFISVSLLYEDHLVENRNLRSRKQSKHSEEEETADVIPSHSCFCGKSYKERSGLMNHLRNYHKKAVDHPQYLQERAARINHNFKVNDFQVEHADFIDKLKNGFGLIMLPQLLELIPRALKKKMGAGLQKMAIKKEKIKDNYYFTQHQRKQNAENSENVDKNFALSKKFKESLRKLVINHITVFQRKILTMLRNTAVKPLFQLFIFNCLKTISQIVRPDLYVPLCQLIECISEHCLEWIDGNYQRVFKERGIFCNHISLQSDESYSLTERPYHLDVLMDEYCRHYERKVEGTVLSIASWLFDSFCSFISEVVEDNGKQIQPKGK